MVGGMTKYEIKVLAACHVWYRNMGNKPATDILWKQVRAMCEPRPIKRAADLKPQPHRKAKSRKASHR